MDIIFGPVLSRRFGISLGIDLSPTNKQCNFDCVYCELKPKKAMEHQDKVISVNKILEELQISLENNKKIDVLTFTANGEPTLYPHLEELILKTKKILKDKSIKTLILSNGSKFKECKNALMNFDIVKFSLDSVDELIFKRVDKPAKNLKIDSIKSGIYEFSHKFNGDLIAEILIVKNINDKKEHLLKSIEFLKTLKLTRVDLSTIDRPSSYNVKPVENEKLKELSKLFVGLNVNVANRKKTEHYEVDKNTLNEKDILNLIRRRPLNINDCIKIMNDESLSKLEKLKENGLITIKTINENNFFYIK